MNKMNKFFNILSAFLPTVQPNINSAIKEMNVIGNVLRTGKYSKGQVMKKKNPKKHWCRKMKEMKRVANPPISLPNRDKMITY